MLCAGLKRAETGVPPAQEKGQSTGDGVEVILGDDSSEGMLLDWNVVLFVVWDPGAMLPWYRKRGKTRYCV